MHDDLEVIAKLEFGKAIERISQESQEKTRKVQTMPRGGQMEHTKLKVHLDLAEEKCRAYAQIWQDLLEKKNGGYLTREDVTFINQKVQQVVEASTRSLMKGPTPWRVASPAQEIGTRMGGVASSIRRDLEIRFRKQQAFPREEITPIAPHVNVTIHSAANVNLGSQVGNINATLNAISEQSPAHQEIAAALKELSEAVLRSQQIEDSQRQEALQVITAIAEQAEAKPEARSIGTLKALLAGLPTVIGLAADLTTLWDKYVPLIRQFFGI